MKRRHAFLWLGLSLCLGLSACGIGQHQNPVASDGELATTQPVSAGDQVTTYTTRRGDTLAGIAGRSEIYGDPALWPLLRDANHDVARKAFNQRLRAGLVLQVPRDSDAATLDRARARDRRAQAALKARQRRRVRAARLRPPASVALLRRVPTAVPGLAATPRPTAMPTPMPLPRPAPATHGGLHPLLLLLLVVLLALGAVLWAFSRRDRDGGA